MFSAAISENLEDLHLTNNKNNNANKNIDLQVCQATFRTIVASPNAFFKNQQRGEPDLTDEEKFDIVEDLFRNDPEKFLERYWKLLSKDDVPCLAHIPSSDLLDGYKEQIFKGFQDKPLNPHAVKNRRFRKMMELIKEGEYFSDEEMKKRDPLTYEQMVGKFLNSKDTNPVSNQDGHMLSTFFINHLQVMQNNELYLKQVEEEKRYLEHERVNKSMKECVVEDSEEEEDDEREDVEKYEIGKDEVSATEKSYLKKEFIDIMEDRFLRGEDADFNYENVDNNEELDSIDIINHDAEDKYFDDDDGYDNDEMVYGNGHSAESDDNDENMEF